MKNYPHIDWEILRELFDHDGLPRMIAEFHEIKCERDDLRRMLTKTTMELGRALAEVVRLQDLTPKQ